MKLPQIKKTISSFLLEEDGKITKQSALTLGSILGAAAIGTLATDIANAATHTNDYGISWDAGNIKGEHSHHSSHASHSSHSSHSSHGSHSSHATHTSHASHSAHGNHTSHSSHGNA